MILLLQPLINMSPNSKNTILTWAVVILIIANIIVIILFWLGHQRQQRPHQTPADFLTKELGLDAKQQAQLHVLANQHHLESEKIRENIKQARDHFFELMKQTNVQASVRDSAASTIALNLKNLELLTYDHFQHVRMLCTPDQQKTFDRIIEKVVKMIAGPPPGPPPGERPPHGRIGGNGPPGEPPTEPPKDTL